MGGEVGRSRTWVMALATLVVSPFLFRVKGLGASPFLTIHGPPVVGLLFNVLNLMGVFLTESLRNPPCCFRLLPLIYLEGQGGSGSTATTPITLHSSSIYSHDWASYRVASDPKI